MKTSMLNLPIYSSSSSTSGIFHLTRPCILFLPITEVRTSPIFGTSLLCKGYHDRPTPANSTTDMPPQPETCNIQMLCFEEPAITVIVIFRNFLSPYGLRRPKNSILLKAHGFVLALFVPLLNPLLAPPLPPIQSRCIW